MSIEKDIQRLFEEVLERHGGNKAAAAESLGVNPVTFWHWVTKTRNLPSTLCKAIDNAGGKLLLPGERPAAPLVQQQIESLQKDIRHLEEKNTLLQKLVDKYEEEAHVKKEDSENRGSHAPRPAPTFIPIIEILPGTDTNI